MREARPDKNIITRTEPQMWAFCNGLVQQINTRRRERPGSPSSRSRLSACGSGLPRFPRTSWFWKPLR